VAHITSVCAVCKGKAHFCELCQDEDNLVFPFQLHRITQCGECKSYFHKVPHPSTHAHIAHARTHTYTRTRTRTHAHSHIARMN
jgi:hypothetical protein